MNYYQEFILMFVDMWQGKMQVFFVCVLAFICYRVVKKIIPFLFRLSLGKVQGFINRSNKIEEKRIKTLSDVTGATLFVIILVYVVYFVFKKLGVDVGPFVVAGAGAVSFAIAFGSQSLVKDVIAGIFIILENQYNKGDRVKIDSFEGRVVDINLRRTVLETNQGAKHIIPNGRISAITNHSNVPDFSVFTIDIPLKIDENFQEIEKLINQEGQKLSEEKKLKEFITEIPKIKEIIKIDNGTATIRVTGKAKSQKRTLLKRELAKRITSILARIAQR